LLSRADCQFADFGTRRRRNYATQDQIVSELRTVPGFMGTSNVHLARVHGVKPIGTNLTNDFDGSRPLNIVIKLKAIDGRAVAKLTDDPGKASGPSDALQAARQTFLGNSAGG